MNSAQRRCEFFSLIQQEHHRKMSKTYARSSKKNSTAATALAVQAETCSRIQKKDHHGKRKQLPKVIDVPEVRVKKARQPPVVTVQESALAPVIPQKRGAKKNKTVDKNLALVGADKKVPPVSRRKSPRSLDAKVSLPIAKQRRHGKVDSVATDSSKPSRSLTPTPASRKSSRSQTPFKKAGQRKTRGASRS
jgi:hypothetical protein